MNGAKQALWLFMLLAILATTGWFFARDKKEVKLDQHRLANTADIRVSQLSIRQFDKNGKLINHLHSPGLYHIPYEDKYFVSFPTVMVQHDANDIWHIRSKKALLLQGGERITFKEDVQISQRKSLTGQDVSLIKTEYLTYYPKLKKAYTNEYVSFEQAGTKIESLGMEAWLDKKMVKLLKQARGHYVPSVA
jgi:lipopolysaccharide export system protein LptC